MFEITSFCLDVGGRAPLKQLDLGKSYLGICLYWNFWVASKQGSIGDMVLVAVVIVPGHGFESGMEHFHRDRIFEKAPAVCPSQ